MKARIILSIFSAIILLTSCEGFLTQTPPTSISKDSAYMSEASLESNMNSIYSGLSFFASNPFYLYLCSASLMQEYTGRRTTEDYLQTHTMTMWSTTTSNNNLYSSLYASVAKCNTFIKGLENSPVADEFKVKIGAEARMMRALYYFTLTRLYGDLPLVTEPVEDDEQYNIKRSQYSQVYELIVTDLLYAAQHMSPYEEVGVAASKNGKLCNMAAYALLSSVYLQMACLLENPDDQFYNNDLPERRPDFSICDINTYQDALSKSLEAARTVINSDVYRLEKNYCNLFRWDPINYPEDYLSRERIITFSATPMNVTSSIVPWMLWDNPQGTESNNIHNGNAGRIRASRWIFQKWAERYEGTLSKVQSCPVYVDCPDPRFDASYFHTEVWGVPTGTSANAGQLVKTTVYPARVKVSAKSDPYIKKYFSKRYKTDNGDADFYIMRYAEVLLNAAEAAARLSSSPSDSYGSEAIGYVNLLMKRARESVNDPSQPSAQPADWYSGTFEDTDQLVQSIIWERVFELGNEGHEWFDTHRLGARWLIENVCKPLNIFNHLPENEKFWEEAFNETDLTEDVAEARKALLLAFPEYETRYNTSLSSDDQNDFFIK